MDFFLFLLVNFTLFLRPAEIVPALEALPIYNYTILAAFALTVPKVATHLKPAALAREPITFCVLGLLGAVVLSHLAHFDFYNARERGFEFLKVVIYYLLLISVVDSTRRLRQFLYGIAIFTTLSATVAMLDHFEYIDIPTLSAYRDRAGLDDQTGEMSTIMRLRATGIFNDPNDLAMIAVVAFVTCLYALGEKELGLARFVWLVPAAVLLTTIGLTKSRGGVMALGMAIATLSYFRFGIWKTSIVLALFVPLAGYLIAGRETGFEGSTGESRVELWSDGLMVMRQSPLFGIGSGNFVDEVGMVAHNSFVHCFTELGLLGGALFLGAFWFAGVNFRELGSARNSIFQQTADPSFRRMRPYILSLLVGFTVSIMSLSRSYSVPTYLVLGTVDAYCVEAQRQGIPCFIGLTPGRLARLIPLSCGFLAAIYLFIKLSIR